jgi:hypothetical protein
MKHELIKTEDYLLVVSDEVIEDVRPYVGRYHLEKGNMIHQFPTYLTDLSECKLIIAHRPLNEAPYLDGVDVLPEIEGDLHIYDALGYAGSEGHPDPQAFSDRQMALFQGYADGFEKAKETYKYTEEDILIIRNKLVDILPTGDVSAWDMINAISSYTKWFDNFIQSLNQPKLPIAFESYTQRFADSDNILKQWDGPKTFTNSEGRTEWFGKYKFK